MIRPKYTSIWPTETKVVKARNWPDWNGSGIPKALGGEKGG